MNGKWDGNMYVDTLILGIFSRAICAQKPETLFWDEIFLPFLPPGNANPPALYG